MSSTDDRQKTIEGEVKTLAGDTEVSLKFLRDIYPEGPWCLTAIAPDKKGIETRTFFPASEAECREWISKRNGSRNCYYHVNPVIGLLTEKARREDIARVCYFHVDVDPVNDTALQPLAQQQDAILARFDEKLPQGVPPPTFLIFSGGGYQALWKLAEPLEIGGDLARAEDVKRYNQHLEALFGADNCHNIDRLMRLPGTINIPDAKKLAKGRVPTMATVVVRKPERVYEVGTFKQAAPASLDDKPNKASTTVAVDRANVTRLADLDALKTLGKWTSDDAFRRLAVIIMQGEHPDPAEVAKKTKNGKPPSRSEWLFDVVCNLLRAEVPDDVIYSIITDERFGISASVLELKGGAHRYAIKQITSGKEHQIEPALAEMNARYFVVQVANKTLVGEWIEDFFGLDSRKQPIMRKRIQFMTLAEWQSLHEARKVQVGTDKDGKPLYKEAGKWWRKHEKRRQYRRLVFRPDINEDTIPNESPYPDLNLWQNFTVDPGRGERHLPFVAFMREVICARDETKFSYLWKWMAFKAQNPAERGQVAPVLFGERGTGKTFWAEEFTSLFGQHAIVLSSPDTFVGKFNALLRDCCLLISDEAYYPKDKKHQSVLKTRITGATTELEKKGIDSEIVPNHLGIVLLSNDPHVVPAGNKERRYFVANVSEERLQQTAYFEALSRMMLEGGREDLLGALLREDLSGFNPREFPWTDELDEQIAQTKGASDIAERVRAALAELPFGAFQTTDMIIALGIDKADRETQKTINDTLIEEGWKYGTVQLYVIDEKAPEQDWAKDALGERMPFIRREAPASYWHKLAMPLVRAQATLDTKDQNWGVLRIKHLVWADDRLADVLLHRLVVAKLTKRKVA